MSAVESTVARVLPALVLDQDRQVMIEALGIVLGLIARSDQKPEGLMAAVVHRAAELVRGGGEKARG